MRKILCIVLTVLILIFTLYSSYAVDLNELQQQYNEMQDNINQANEELNNIQNELSENLQQVQLLDEQIVSAEAEVKDLEEKIQDLQIKIQEEEVKLKRAKENYDKNEEVLEERLVAIYEAGDIQFLDVMFSSTSISNFLSNYFLISEVVQYDMELLEDIEREKNEIEQSTKKLEQSKTQLTTLKKNAQKTATLLQSTKKVRENYISKLSEEERNLQTKIDEYNSQVNEIESQIKAITSNSISEEYIGGEMIWPVPGYTTITSKYGMRTHPITGVYKLHSGVDIGAPLGASFVAMANGIVTKAGFNTAYGNMVMIDHGGGVSTLYAHGSEIVVEVGQTVNKGDSILKVGSTGYSTGPHAHFEVRINGETVDPINYMLSIKQEEKEEVKD